MGGLYLKDVGYKLIGLWQLFSLPEAAGPNSERDGSDPNSRAPNWTFNPVTSVEPGISTAEAGTYKSKALSGREDRRSRCPGLQLIKDNGLSELHWQNNGKKKEGQRETESFKQWGKPIKQLIGLQEMVHTNILNGFRVVGRCVMVAGRWGHAAIFRDI